MHVQQLFDSLYTSKLHDSGNEYTEKDYNRFIAQISSAYKHGILDFSCQQIGMSVLTKLTKVLRTAPHIRKFIFYGNNITDHGLHSLFQLLQVNPRITVIDIGCNDITNQGVPSLQDIILRTKITSLQLGVMGQAWHINNFTTAASADLLLAVHQSDRIECLGLSGIQLSIRQGARRISIASYFADFIASYTKLKSLSLSDCGFTPSDAEVVFLEGIAKNSRLVYLDCSNNTLIDPIGIRFCDRLQNITALRRIYLSYCNLSDDAGKALARSLKNSQLISLDISHNNIATAGFTAILEALKDNIYLTELYASYNSFDYGCSEALLNLINENQVISVLDLSRSAIGDEGAIAIARYLAKNEALCTLDLSTCKITGEGAVAIAEAIAVNKNVMHLSLADNFLTREEGYELIDIFRVNEILREINLTSTQIDHFVIQAACDICKRNRQIQYEQDLQPLKQEMIQLSIQRTKMPEATARLHDLRNQFADTTAEIMKTEINLSDLTRKANRDIDEIKRQIAGVESNINQNEKEMENMRNDFERVSTDANALYEGTVQKSKGLEASIEAVNTQIENEIKSSEEEQAKFSEEKAKLLAEIEENTKMTQEITALLQNEEELMNYKPPDWYKDSSVFITEEIRPPEKKKSTSRSRKSSSSKKSTKTRKRTARK